MILDENFRKHIFYIVLFCKIAYPSVLLMIWIITTLDQSHWFWNIIYIDMLYSYQYTQVLCGMAVSMVNLFLCYSLTGAK